MPDATNPQAFNRYTYVLNNPIALIDPTGHYYYDPACDCLVDTGNAGSEHPNNMNASYIPGMAGRNYINGWGEQYRNLLEAGILQLPDGLSEDEYVAQLVIEDHLSSHEYYSHSTFGTIAILAMSGLDFIYQAIFASDKDTSTFYAYVHAEGDALDDLTEPQFLRQPSSSGSSVPRELPSPSAGLEEVQRILGPEWRPPVNPQANWYNPKTGEWLRADLSHSNDVIGPHWDYNFRGSGHNGWRIFPDGRIELKN